MKLIVGLGNPGKDYEGTRHNIGFELLELFAKKHSVALTKTKFEAVYGEFEKHGEKVLLVFPQTYMNLSGRSVSAFMQFFKIALQDLLILQDELDLPLGQMKVIRKGGAAGHRGILSIQESLGSQDFTRFRIGIGRPTGNEEVADFVLKKFQKSERTQLEPLLEKSIKGLDLWLEKGVEAALLFCHKSE